MDTREKARRLALMLWLMALSAATQGDN